MSRDLTNLFWVKASWWFFFFTEVKSSSDITGFFSILCFHDEPPNGFLFLQVGAEKDVSFDHGIKGSIAEDCCFAMHAFMKGYSFDFINGAMHEMSPFTFWDFILQRKRWVQGILLVLLDSEIQWKYKIMVACQFFAWILTPINQSVFITSLIFPQPLPIWISIVAFTINAVNIYLYIFGTLKSISVYRHGLLKYGLCIIWSVFAFLLTTVLESVAITMALLSDKKKFYVVAKDWTKDGTEQAV